MNHLRPLIFTLPLLLAGATPLACKNRTPPPSETPVPEQIEQPTPEPQVQAPRSKYLAGEIVPAQGQPLEWMIELTPAGEDADQFERAVLWIPSQGIGPEPFDTIDDRGDQVVLRWDVLGLEYTIDYADELDCEFRQQGNEFECRVEAIDQQTFAEYVTPRRPQEPSEPYPYTVEQVRFGNQQTQDVVLAGTLTIPQTPGPHPAAILISDSGQQDRDQAQFGHKPFWILADHLTRQGIAVLRYDDRGFAESTGGGEDATLDDITSDAWSAVQFLAIRPDIDAREIGLIGHAEGGVVVARVAADHPKQLAYMVLLAGIGVSGAQLLESQLVTAMEASGVDPSTVERERRYTQRLAEAVVKTPPDQLAATLEPILREWVDELSPAERAQLGDVDQAIAMRIETLSSPWMRQFLAYDPAPILRKLKIPVLVVTGERDLQTVPSVNVPPIEAALARNKHAKVVTLPGLNHMLQPSVSGSPHEYGLIETTIDESALRLISSWIADQVGLPAQAQSPRSQSSQRPGGS